MPDVGANGKVAPCLGLFTIAAFATSMVASYSCEFISFFGVSAGIWQRKDPLSGDCVDYRVDVSDQVKAARGMAVLTTIFGFILMIVGCAAVCMPFPAKMFKCFGVAYFFTTIFEGLKFLVVIDSQNYDLEYGANCGIAATCLWFVTMLMSCAVKPSEDDDSSPKEVEESAKEEEPKNEENENTEEEPKNEEEAKPDEEA